jgi:hypothetical protein
MNELKVIEKNFKSKSYLNDGVKYNSIIEMKRDLIELLEVIDISDVFRELYERENYQVECWNEQYWNEQYEGTKVEYKNLNKGSAKAIRNKKYDELIKLMKENNCNYINYINYIISWWSNGEYHYF